MLKSTHKAAAPAPPLPEGWTAHKAPTGHTYYYNATTKKSTYTRPTTSTPETSEKPELTNTPTGSSTQADISRIGFQDSGSSFSVGIGFPGAIQQSHIGFNHHGTGRPEPKDRPKSKQAIPGASPWLLVQTKLGRRFVYNPELNESFWKFPSDVLKCVVELDRKQRERRERRERGEPSESEPEEEPAKKAEDESDEYEEVEVTDDEDESNAAKRPRYENEQQPQGPMEFNEDDIAYQLAAMGQEDDYDNYDAEQGEWDGEEEELSPEDARALFYDLLDDYHINPFTPWDSIVEEGKIIEDDRYLYLPNMRARKEAWEAWSHDRIQKLKAEKARQEKKDPKIPYMAFLQKHATPKLYWPEFKRKFRKEAEMRDSKITDKDREKWYREHINRLKLPESILKSDLTNLLKAVPLRSLNRSTSLAALPPELLTDLRYISLRPSVRDPLVEAYIAMLPAAPDREDISPEEELEIAKRHQERERREKALRDREQRVEASKRQQDYALRASKGAMKAGEEEIRQAMQVGKDGLLGHLKDDEMER